jgi:hypothetical protein
MSKRLQVVVGDADLESYERIARVEGLSVSEWVRRTLGAARREASAGDVDAKISAVREALRHDYPAPDIDAMLGEIEAGYRGAGDA